MDWSSHGLQKVVGMTAVIFTIKEYIMLPNSVNDSVFGEDLFQCPNSSGQNLIGAMHKCKMDSYHSLHAIIDLHCHAPLWPCPWQMMVPSVLQAGERVPDVALSPQNQVGHYARKFSNKQKSMDMSYNMCIYSIMWYLFILYILYYMISILFWYIFYYMISVYIYRERERCWDYNSWGTGVVDNIWPNPQWLCWPCSSCFPIWKWSWNVRNVSISLSQ